MLSIDLDDWMVYNFNRNVIDAIDYNNFAVFDTFIFFIFDSNCCYFIQFNIGFINICLFLVNRSNWNVLFSSNNDWGSWYEFATSKCDWFSNFNWFNRLVLNWNIRFFWLCRTYDWMRFLSWFYSCLNCNRAF